MKCTDNLFLKYVNSISVRAAVLSAAALLFVSGCGTKTYELEHAYDVYGTSIHYDASPADADASGQAADSADSADSKEISYFASKLCVASKKQKGTKAFKAEAAEAAGVFHLSDGTVTYSKNIYKKLYPASTTKILTAYIALKYGTLTDGVTVSEQAAPRAGDAAVCGLHTGDRLTLEELLYGLLLKSGNDAADAIAEHISGDPESFARLMNEEAALLGATHSHFTNPHGLQDENHYTCVYDLYLMFNAALEYEEFQTIIKASNHTASYTDVNGTQVTQDWETTDRYLNGTAQPPEGVEVVGGKTGTTSDAGNCLALYSINAMQEPVISIVLKADSSDNLYSVMSELLVR